MLHHQVRLKLCSKWAVKPLCHGKAMEVIQSEVTTSDWTITKMFQYGTANMIGAHAEGHFHRNGMKPCFKPRTKNFNNKFYEPC